MDFIIDFIFGFIRELLFEIPGASIRWMYFRGKRSFKDILDDDETIYNFQLSILFVIILVLIIVLL